MSDVIVVGGGPAGACLALLLGRQGVEVELLEQARVPRDKPCGEGLLPPGVEVLRAAGLADAVGGEKLNGVRYHVGNGSVRAGFARGASGVGQKRMVLDAALWNAAARTPHVRATDGARIDAPLVERGRVTGVIVDGDARRARWVVGADGSSSTLRRVLGMERMVCPRRVGVRAHFRLARHEAFRDIQIFMRPGYELYVTPLPQGEVLVAALAFQAAVRNGLRSSFRYWIEREPLLQTWLDGATQTSELAGRAPLVKQAGARPPAGLVFLGDAATSVDPVTAGGLSLALSSAALLSSALPAALAGDGRALVRFERSRARAVRAHRWLGVALLALAERPRVAEWARRCLRNRPSALDALVELVA